MCIRDRRNAIRFEPPGGRIEVSTRVDEAGATIEVRDHGRGVPEHDLERIFEAFYRVAEARERSSGGTGLGLAITARVMALHGGHSKAHNAPDGGLIIELYIPLSLIHISTELTGTIGMISPKRTFPDGLIALPFVVGGSHA